jgi:succinoglycan biosynthesis protein ExoM
MSQSIVPHISVCICTYKRLRFLERLLERLYDQQTDNLFDYAIIVVDNDVEKSAEFFVTNFRKGGNLHISYFNEPRRSFSHARNKAVENAKGDFIAFVDDDEVPENNWLLNLYRTFCSFKADGVLGPVIPYFEIQPPQWTIRSHMFKRDRYSTGTSLTLRDLRTGNVLLAKHIFNANSPPFNPRFGRTGGEDGDFFRRMLEQGFSFVWCDEAPAYETVPPERYSRKYFIKRALLRGVSEARLIKANNAKIPSLLVPSVVKSLIASSLYTFALPILFIIGRHIFMKFLIKDCDHIGKLLALCGIEVIKERNF